MTADIDRGAAARGERPGGRLRSGLLTRSGAVFWRALGLAADALEVDVLLLESFPRDRPVHPAGPGSIREKLQVVRDEIRSVGAHRRRAVALGTLARVRHDSRVRETELLRSLGALVLCGHVAAGAGLTVVHDHVGHDDGLRR